MTNWLKRFINKLSAEREEAEKAATVPPMPDVKTPKANETPFIVPDLSEPVISFVECYRKNPGRFMTKATYRLYGSTTYKILDKKNKEEWRVHFSTSKYSYEDDDHENYISDATWATQDELKYVVENISKIAIERALKLDTIRKVRYKRSMIDERKRLMGVYCAQA